MSRTSALTLQMDDGRQLEFWLQLESDGRMRLASGERDLPQFSEAMISPSAQIHLVNGGNLEHGTSARVEATEQLLRRCYQVGHRDGWEAGESSDEVLSAVADYFAIHRGEDEVAPPREEETDGQS